MNCSYCGKPIVLIPSAQERARKFGGTASYYVRLFTIHSDCQIKSRQDSVTDLINRNYRH